MIYWRRYGGDYLVSTIGFTMEMDGAYGRYLDNYYEREGPLPDDEVMQIARATTPSEMESARKVLERKFKKRADGWHHDRADAEIALAIQARDNGGKHVGKSGKVTRTRTGKPTRRASGEATDTVTGEITGKVTDNGSEKATQNASQNAQESTVQPSTSQPSAVQPSSAQPGGNPPPQEPPRPRRPRSRAKADNPPAQPPAQEPRVEPPDPEDLDEQLAHAGNDEIPWWHSWNGITSMALERGVKVEPGQPHEDFVARVFVAAGPGPWADERPDLRERIEHFRAQA